MKMNKIILGLTALFLTNCGNQYSESSKNQFLWDFSEERTIIYSFIQIGEITNKSSIKNRTEFISVEAIGHIKVDVNENNLADLSLMDLEMKMITYNASGNSKDTVEMSPTPSMVKGMKPNGNFVDQKHDLVFDLLFPLPTKKLAQNESDEVKMQIPFNVEGSQHFVNGQNTITFKGYEEVEGRKCAILEGVIDVSELDTTSELDEGYNCSMTGTGMYYFDLNNGHYVGADINIIMVTMFKNNSDFETFSEMTNKDSYKIRLEKIDE